MVAVSDTSPISNLALIGRLDLLRAQFEQVWIPDAVMAEFDRIPSPLAKASIEQALQAGWLQCRLVESSGLGRGNTAKRTGVDDNGSCTRD